MNAEHDFILLCQDKVLSGKKLDNYELEALMNSTNLRVLSEAANKITRMFQGNKVDVEHLANIKKNYCSEDCNFCGQSAFFNTNNDGYQLLPAEQIVLMAKKAKNEGAESYCLVAAWRQPSKGDFEQVCDIINQINEQVGINIECSLGFLTDDQAKKLKELGVRRYNHNLETARSKFPEICTTHTYQDRIDTLLIARRAGLELCTGGIIGLGETRKQRLELIFDLAWIEPEEVTINILVPIPGTPLQLQTPLPFEEILRVFAVTRFALPKSIIKISGGREVHLQDDGQELLLSGANGIISSGYLTLGGNEMKKDLEMIKRINLEA
ncbi:MAG: biotin synthase BioB [Candidatus Nitrosotenuis sp.]